MKTEKKKEFIARISQANRSQLTVIIFDVILDELKEAVVAADEGRNDDMLDSMKMAQRFVEELIASLDHKYAIANELRPIYLFVNKEIIYSIITRSTERLPKVGELMESLRDSFEQVSHSDFSEPLMQNTQKIYAGLTYGKGQLNETAIDAHQSDRGFLV